MKPPINPNALAMVLDELLSGVGEHHEEEEIGLEKVRREGMVKTAMVFFYDGDGDDRKKTRKK